MSPSRYSYTRKGSSQCSNAYKNQTQ
ncbi:hypothetical protein Pint_29307 [Pistacia integerrima]|uniref:Uncharacterized protein n=1 Tax=Pistacia integerrima TaxID=434235 RepID=A0ACC0X0B9_9ROSI|nr:hypothetical protein Pint_29307 [Pistacia integerrima]